MNISSSAAMYGPAPGDEFLKLHAQLEDTYVHM